MHAALHRTSIFQPSRQPRFRAIWAANLLSNLGTWGQAFAAAWHVAALSGSAATAALVQTATWAPMLLFALPAGLLADCVHKPRLLLRSNAWMGMTAAAMAWLTLCGTPSAALLLALTFLLGTGAAFTQPAWQASMAELVAHDDIAAVVALNNLSYNLAALAGPGLGGLVLQHYGPGPLYVFNAASFCGLLWFYRQWQRQGGAQAPLQRPGMQALLAGVAASRRSVRYRRLLLHTACIYGAANALPALLPSLLRGSRGQAAGFGLLMGALGGGAVLASVLLPALRRRFAQPRLLAGALLLYGAMLALIVPLTAPGMRVALIACGGIAWSAIVTTLNRAALTAFPAALRSRTLSAYIFMAAAGQALAGVLWGQLAGRFGIPAALGCAAAAMLACAASISRFPHRLDDA